MKPLRLLTILVTTMGLSAFAFASQPEDKGKNDKSHNDKSHNEKSHNEGGKHSAKSDNDNDAGDWDDRYRRDFDESDFRSFTRTQHYGGYEALPPGIRKNLARGKPLPPGIAKREIPPDMLRRLPVREGYEWRAVGTDVVLYSIASGVVDQVLQDVFLH